MKKVFIIVLLALVLLPSCKKGSDSPAPQSDGCTPFPPAYGLGYNEVNDRYAYYSPVFSADNPDEFYFIRWDSKERISTIMGGNIRKPEGVKEIITIDVFREKSLTASDKYLVFTRMSDNQFWRINKNGTGLQQITNYQNIVAHYPSFYSTGDKLVFNYNGNIVANAKIMVIDVNGNHLDSFYQFNVRSAAWLYPCANKDGLLAFQYYDGKSKGLILYNLKQQQDTILYLREYHSYADMPVSHCWHPNGEDIYFLSDYSVNEINIYTRQKNVVKQGCNNIRYEAFALSSDGKHALCQKVTRKYLGENTVNVDYEIYLTDGHFKNERKVSE
jgi:Tol biopolymer transport system component